MLPNYMRINPSTEQMKRAEGSRLDTLIHEARPTNSATLKTRRALALLASGPETLSFGPREQRDSADRKAQRINSAATACFVVTNYIPSILARQLQKIVGLSSLWWDSRLWPQDKAEIVGPTGAKLADLPTAEKPESPDNLRNVMGQ